MKERIQIDRQHGIYAARDLPEDYLVGIGCSLRGTLEQTARVVAIAHEVIDHVGKSQRAIYPQREWFQLVRETFLTTVFFRGWPTVNPEVNVLECLAIAMIERGISGR